MPCGAGSSLIEFRDLVQNKVDSSVRELSRMHEKVDHCQEEINELKAEISNLRNKMAKIELMTENPRIFAIESMHLENIAHVFMEIEKWSQMFEELKETIRHWDEKRTSWKKT